MTYFNVEADYAPKVTGKRDGSYAVEKNRNSFQNKEFEKKFNSFFVDNYRDKNRILLDSFKKFEEGTDPFITYFPKTKSIKQLDFMTFGPYEHGLQFLISQKAFSILSKYKLPVYNKISAVINSFDVNYLLIGFPMLPEEVIDFTKSSFFDYTNGVPVKYKNLEDYNTADFHRKLATPIEVHLISKFDFDILNTIKGLYFSSRIIKDFQKEGITGYIIKDGILEN